MIKPNADELTSVMKRKPKNMSDYVDALRKFRELESRCRNFTWEAGLWQH